MKPPLIRRVRRALQVLTGKPMQQRRYQAARGSRLTAGWSATNTSSDAEISTSLTELRGRSRSLGRDSAYAKRAKTIVVDNIVGAGMGLQGQVKASRDSLRKASNDGIEEAWCEWSKATTCHTGGAMSFSDIERAAISEVFEAGEVFIRMHPTSFGGSPIPFALEFIESERVPHESAPQVMGVGANRVRMGIEIDPYYRAQSYWVYERHPGDYETRPGVISNRLLNVPAEQILHLRLVSRWPQTRGVPWLHATMKTFNDMDGYADAEITAARGAANYMGWLETSDLDDPDIEEQEDGSYQTELAPGTIGRGPPGSKIDFLAPNRPNTALPDFMRYMLRQVSAGSDISYESLSKDFSQSNYSSSRLSLLDERDRWRMLQLWFMQFRCVIHCNWLRQAVLAGQVDGVPLAEYAVNPEKFEAAKFKARGWGWVDPAKEVAAYKEALKAGFTTRTQIISATNGGTDIEDVDTERAEELKRQKELELVYDTDPGQPMTVTQKPTPDTAATADPGGDPAGAPAGDMPSQAGRLRVIQ